MITLIGVWALSSFLCLILCNCYDVWFDGKEDVGLFDFTPELTPAYLLGPIGLLVVIVFGIIEVISKVMPKPRCPKWLSKLNPKIS